MTGVVKEILDAKWSNGGVPMAVVEWSAFRQLSRVTITKLLDVHTVDSLKGV